MTKGTIKRLITGRAFGFIGTEEGGDIFFHLSDLQGVDYYSLREGQEVEYEVGQGKNGRSRAVGVKLAGTEISQDEAATLEDPITIEPSGDMPGGDGGEE
ncbi:cold-shock protein [Chloroflexota bacterium]